MTSLYNRWIQQRCCQSKKIWHNFCWQHRRFVHEFFGSFCSKCHIITVILISKAGIKDSIIALINFILPASEIEMSVSCSIFALGRHTTICNTVAIDELLCLKNAAAQILMFFLTLIIGTHDNWKNQSPGVRFGATR